MFNEPQQQTPTQGDIQSGNAADVGQSQPAQAPPPVAQPQAAQPAPASAVSPAAAQPQAPTVPAATPASTSKSPGLHHFISSVLGALSGTPPPTYTVDATNGKLVALPAAPQTNGQKIKRLVNTSLQGLAAGSQVPPQKSGLAAVAAGLGAGANAVDAKQEQANQANKQSAREDFERDQQLKLRKMEIARANALQWTNHIHNIQAQNELDPQRTQNMSVAKDLEEAGVSVRYMTADEAEAAAKGDMQFTATHTLLPLGFKPMSDSNGNPILDANGQPKSQGQVAVIDGMHDGKVPMPKAWADDVQQYGKLAGIKGYESIKEGDEYGMDQINVLHGKVLAAKKQELQGWVDGEEGFGGLDGKTPGKINKVTGEFKPNTAGVIPSKLAETAANIAEKQQQVKTGKSTETKNYAEAKKAGAEAKNAATSNLTGSDYLQTLPTAQRGIVQAVGEGRQKLPANRKEALALLEQVHQAYPDFDESKVATWQKASNEYRGSGKTATQIVPAYNTALEHMQDLYTNTTPDGIFNPLSKAYQDREVASGYVAREVGKAVSAGAMTQKESEDLLSTLKGGLTPSLKRERITKTAQLLHDKIDEFQTKFNESAPSSAVKVPTLISPKAAQSYDFVASGGQTQQQAPQAAPQAQPQQVPAGGQPILRNGQTVGYILNGKRVNF